MADSWEKFIPPQCFDPSIAPYASCQLCGNRWDVIIKSVSPTGGVVVDLDKCPCCKAGYGLFTVYGPPIKVE